MTPVLKKNSYDKSPAQRQRILGDRRPPHNIEMEQALLACVILEGGSEALTACVQEKVKAECFYKPAHQLIYTSMLKLYEAQTPITEVLLIDRLRDDKALEDIGGEAYLIELTNRIDTPIGLTHYIKKVRDLYLLREIIRASNESVEAVYEDASDVASLIEQIEQRIFTISEDRFVDHAQPVSKSVDTAVAMINQYIDRKGELTGVSTGFADLDKMTTGWHATEMIVVAARPSMGKTAIALNMAEAAILPSGNAEPVPSLIFSLEMGADQLAMRLLCSRGRVNMTKLRDGFLPRDKQQELVRAAQELKDSPLYIDDSSGLTILELRAKARRLSNQLKHGLGMIIVDYLQLLAGSDPRVPREQQIAEISRGMKGMAKELNLPVIVLGQLNRESEREKRQPRLSDLRESGSIEQDADVVLLLSKPREYNPEEDMAADIVARDLIVAKQRNGPVGSVPLHFTKNLTRFENYTPKHVSE